MNEPDTVSTIEAARLLGMAVRSVQLMVDRGELAAWRTPGGHRRIARESVLGWLRGRGAVPGPAARAAAPPRRRVLLIEDSAHFRKLVQLLVERAGGDIELRSAEDGIAGLAALGEWKPELVIVDILLPGIDGATLIGRLRSDPQFAHLRLLVLTSLGAAERAPYAMVLDGVPVVHKPRMLEELLPRLRSLLVESVPAVRTARAP